MPEETGGGILMKPQLKLLKTNMEKRFAIMTIAIQDYAVASQQYIQQLEAMQEKKKVVKKE